MRIQKIERLILATVLFSDANDILEGIIRIMLISIISEERLFYKDCFLSRRT